jgi:RNA polymerase sigma-70 factor (ECF subfamily)
MVNAMKVTSLAPQAEAVGGRQAAGSLEEAFARYQDELLGTLFHLLGNVEDARDAVQETFIKCWRHRDGLPEIANVKAWIFRVALNTGRDLRRAAGRRQRLIREGAEAMVVRLDDNPGTALDQQEQLARVSRAVSDLRPEEQEVFLLRQNGEMTYEEIARAVGIPLNTAKTRMRLALAKLRAALQPSGTDELA